MWLGGMSVSRVWCQVPPGGDQWLCGVRRGDNIIQDKEIYIPTFCKVFIFADGPSFNSQICQVRLNYAFQGDIGSRALLPFSMLPWFYFLNRQKWFTVSLIEFEINPDCWCHVMQFKCSDAARGALQSHCQGLSIVTPCSLWSVTLTNREIKVPRWPPSSPLWPLGPCPSDLYQHSRATIS